MLETLLGIGVVVGGVVWLFGFPRYHPFYWLYRGVKWLFTDHEPGTYDKVFRAESKRSRRQEEARRWAGACKSGCPFDFAGNVVNASEARKRFPHLLD